jgi:hypothetical protein
MTTIQVIENLNEKIFNKYEDSAHSFWMHTDGFFEVVLFNEIILWNSSEDDRLFIEEINEYEPLFEFIIKKLNDYITDINNIRNLLVDFKQAG